MTHWKVVPGESGLKLISFLKAKLPETISARQIKRAIEAGHCFFNEKIERFASKSVGTGDRIRFTLVIETPTYTHQKETSIQDSILYLDDDLLAYDKPPGVNSEDPALLKKLSEDSELILLHRLDKQTSGVLLFARSKSAAENFLDLFKQRKIKKTYFAIVDGVPKNDHGTIENHLGKLKNYEGQTLWGTVPPEKGLLAQTKWKVKQKGKEASLIECQPKTGRTHQLRIHLEGIGHPILGDYQYGRSFKCFHRPGRMMLHAAEISFIHPSTKIQIKISSPIPEDFKETIALIISR